MHVCTCSSTVLALNSTVPITCMPTQTNGPLTHVHVYTRAQRLVHTLALTAVTKPPPVSRYEEESEELRAAICELGGSSDVCAALMEVRKRGLLGSAQLKAKLSGAHKVCDGTVLRQAAGRTRCAMGQC